MNLYSIDVKIYGTAYIKADTPEKARDIANKLQWSTLEVMDHGGSDTPISGTRYSDPGLPPVSFSPAMTVHGPDADVEVELAEENIA